MKNLNKEDHCKKGIRQDKILNNVKTLVRIMLSILAVIYLFYEDDLFVDSNFILGYMDDILLVVTVYRMRISVLKVRNLKNNVN